MAPSDWETGDGTLPTDDGAGAPPSEHEHHHALDELRSAEHRVGVAAKIAERATDAGVGLARIYFDPVISTLATDHTQGEEILQAVGRIRSEFPEAHVICGLSNISFGLPGRRLLNHTFLAMLMAAGLDAVIADPTTEGFPELVATAEALLGRDEFCMNYISHRRRG